VHIAEGVLSAPVLLTGAGLTAGGVAIGLWRMDYERIPKVAILSSCFFVASLVHMPVGPSSAHLTLGGLLGLLLGWAAFPAMLVGLFLQAMLFGFGGLTALGVNTLNVALPAVMCHYVWRFGLRLRIGPRFVPAVAGGFLAGALTILMTAVMTAAALALSGPAFGEPAKWIVAFHLPLAIIEGLVTVSVVGFLERVRPELLAVRRL